MLSRQYSCTFVRALIKGVPCRLLQVVCKRSIIPKGCYERLGQGSLFPYHIESASFLRPLATNSSSSSLEIKRGSGRTKNGADNTRPYAVFWCSFLRLFLSLYIDVYFCPYYQRVVYSWKFPCFRFRTFPRGFSDVLAAGTKWFD